MIDYMVQYMVQDTFFETCVVFNTEMEARDYITTMLAKSPDYYAKSDFILYKRERIA